MDLNFSNAEILVMLIDLVRQVLYIKNDEIRVYHNTCAVVYELFRTLFFYRLAINKI